MCMFGGFIESAADACDVGRRCGYGSNGCVFDVELFINTFNPRISGDGECV